MTAVLEKDITAFEKMRSDLEANHFNQWVLFHLGIFQGAFEQFEDAATMAMDRFENGPYLIRQVGASPVALPGGMIFTPSHLLGSSGL